MRRGEDFPTGSYVMPAGAHLPVGLVVGHAADGWPEVAWPTGTECEAPSDLVLAESPARRSGAGMNARRHGKAAISRADRARLSDCLRACAKPLPYTDTEKIALLDLAGRIEKGEL